MDKINFVNNSSPYINATNLNQLQTNVETALTLKTDKTESDNIKLAIDYKTPNYMGDVIVESIRSKNFLNISSFPTQTINGITFTNNNNGTITINGTATNSFGITFAKPKIKAGTYYLSINANSPTDFYLYDYNTNTDILGNNESAVFTQEYNEVGFDTYINSGVTFNNLTISPQLENGTSASEFKQFQNLQTLSTILYNNANGSLSGISLSDNPSNYDYLEIVYADTLNHFSVERIYDTTQKSELTSIGSDGGLMYIFNKIIKFTSNSIDVEGYVFSYFTDNASPRVISEDKVKIYKVIGYKEV